MKNNKQPSTAVLWKRLEYTKTWKSGKQTTEKNPKCIVTYSRDIIENIPDVILNENLKGQMAKIIEAKACITGWG